MRRVGASPTVAGAVLAWRARWAYAGGSVFDAGLSNAKLGLVPSDRNRFGVLKAFAKATFVGFGELQYSFRSPYYAFLI